MPISHYFLTLLIIVIWGLNFIVVKLGLEEIPPLLLCALRFILSSIPALFFVKLPTSGFSKIVWYGLIMFALQFSLTFMSMSVGMTAGMASLLMQVQVFFSMFFAILFLGEEPNVLQVGGALVAFAGIGVVAMHLDNQNISLMGFLLLLAAAASWGLGNLIVKKNPGESMMAYVVWGSFVAIFPLLFLSCWIEGVDSWIYTWKHVTWKGVTSLFYIAFASTWVGYGIWNWILSKHPVSVVVPFTLLIPVVGILGSVALLDEPFQTWKLVAVLLVIGGLCINLLSMRFLWRKTHRTTIE